MTLLNVGGLRVRVPVPNQQREVQNSEKIHAPILVRVDPRGGCLPTPYPFDCAQYCAHQQARRSSMRSDERISKPFVHRRLSQFVDSHPSCRMSLILRATNLCKQGAAGSSPATSTNHIDFNEIQCEVTGISTCHLSRGSGVRIPSRPPT
jgi:hypothetical protein